jgi:hypothetical protein
METVTEHAKQEVNAYVHGTITRAGLSALGVEPFQLTDGTPRDSVDEVQK